MGDQNGNDYRGRAVLRVGWFWRLALGVIGTVVGLWLVSLGTLVLASPIPGFTTKALGVIAFGAGLATWSILGAARPTKLRFIPPAALVSIQSTIWLFNLVGRLLRNV